VKIPSVQSTVDGLLQRVNRSYNDAPKAPSSARGKPVLFLDEADGFVAEVKSLGGKKEQVAAYRELAKRSKAGEVALTPNAATALNAFGKKLGARTRVKVADLHY
jgi:hypothetical protein